MGLSDLIHSHRKGSIDSSDSAKGATKGLETSSSPSAGITSNPKGTSDQGNKVDLGTTTGSGHLPSGTGPGTSGIPSGQTSPTASTGASAGASVGAGAASAGAAGAAATSGSTGESTSQASPSTTLAADPQSGHSIKNATVPNVNDATHDQQHLQEVTQETVRHKEVEEIERQRHVDRHVHHIQHHVQPISDLNVQDEIHHNKVIPTTSVREQHESTPEDAMKFNSLKTVEDNSTHLPVERTVLDLGEKVTEDVQHHVHHVIQPVVQLETVDQHRIHTVAPIEQVTHDAPIVHKSTTHEPMSKSEFLSKGGKLGSGVAHENAGVLNIGDCHREVEGVGEKLASDLHLSSTNASALHSSGDYAETYGSSDAKSAPTV